MIRYKVREEKVTLYTYQTEEVDEVKHTVMIAEKDDDTGVWLPSSLTDYIYSNHSSKSINTQKRWAYLICDFMNYLLSQVELGEDKVFENLKSEGLYGLNFKQGAKFINYLSKGKPRIVKGKTVFGNNYETVKGKENELICFYDFLNKSGITGEDMRVSFKITEKRTSDEFTRKGKRNRGEKVLINPFEDCGVRIDYPPKDGKKIPKLMDMRKADWELLLEIAEEVTPDIALGVAMQFMGGLRVGEVVNLLIDSFRVDEENKDKLLLSIEDRQVELFESRGVKTYKSQVKKTREDQPVFNFNGELFKILKRHMERIKTMPTVNTEALFVDSNGNPMTGEVYHIRFALLKECFLQKLGEKKPSLEKEYRVNYRWGSHIGRHIYTNYLIKTGLCHDSLGTPDARVLANLRGDKYIYSAMAYIDRMAIIASIQERLEELSRLATEV